MKKGFKVVNYNEWSSIPDIFKTLAEAKVARESWEFKKGSIVEMVGSTMRKARVVVR